MYGQLNITETVEFIDGIKLVMFSSYFSKLSAANYLFTAFHILGMYGLWSYIQHELFIVLQTIVKKKLSRV